MLNPLTSVGLPFCSAGSHPETPLFKLPPSPLGMGEAAAAAAELTCHSTPPLVQCRLQLDIQQLQNFPPPLFPYPGVEGCNARPAGTRQNHPSRHLPTSHARGASGGSSRLTRIQHLSTLPASHPPHPTPPSCTPGLVLSELGHRLVFCIPILLEWLSPLAWEMYCCWYMHLCQHPIPSW